LIDRNELLGEKNIFLIFRNNLNNKYISVWNSEEGFDIEELEHLRHVFID